MSNKSSKKMIKVLTFGLSAFTDAHISLATGMDNVSYTFLDDRVYRYPHHSQYEKGSFRIVKFSGVILYDLWIILREFIKFKPDIVEFYFHLSSNIIQIIKCWWILLLTSIFRKKLIVFCTGGEIRDWNFHHILRKITIFFGLLMANVIIYKEYFMKTAIKKIKKSFSKKAFFISNAVYDQYEKFSIKLDKSVVLFFNSFREIRNTEFAVEVAKEILSKRNDVIFLFVGAKNYNELKKVLDLRSGFESSIIPLMMNNNREFFYSIADIFILPADIVWLNMSLLEAMFMKISPVVSDVDFVDKIIKNGKNGLVVKLKDKKAWVEAIERLLDNEELRKRMGKKAHQTVIKRFHYKKRAILHRILYEYALGYRKNVPQKLYDPNVQPFLTLEEVKKFV